MGPEAGGAVMATGIVSVAVLSDHLLTLSRVLLVLTAIGWGALGVVFVARLILERPRLRRDARRPAAMTAVAATAVLGSRLTILGWTWAGWTLLAVAAIVWLVLVGSVVGRAHTTGAEFLLVVAPQSLAVLAALLGQRLGVLWPAVLALAPFLVGLWTYAVVLSRFDFKEPRRGLGDHWVAGGALAISTLACAVIARVASLHHASGSEPLRIITVVFWCLTAAWLPPLLMAEVRWPRLRYDVRRWATVFPLGMYAVMSVAGGEAAHVHAFVELGQAGAWVALGAWSVVAAGAARRAGAHARRALSPSSGR